MESKNIEVEYYKKNIEVFMYKHFIPYNNLTSPDIKNKIINEIIKTVNTTNIDISYDYEIIDIDMKLEEDISRCGKMCLIDIKILKEPNIQLKMPNFDIDNAIIKKFNTIDMHSHIRYDAYKSNKHIIDEFKYVEDMFNGFLLMSKEEYEKIWIKFYNRKNKNSDEKKITAHFYNECVENNIVNILYHKLLSDKHPTTILESEIINKTFDGEDYYRIDVQTKYKYIINYNTDYNYLFGKHYRNFRYDADNTNKGLKFIKKIIKDTNYKSYLYIHEYSEYNFNESVHISAYLYYIESDHL